MEHTVRHFLRGDALDVKLYELDTDAPGVVDGDGYRIKERQFRWQRFGVVSGFATGDEEVQEVLLRTPNGTSRVESLRGLSVASSTMQDLIKEARYSTSHNVCTLPL